jgi:SAM-dependent methyltransferase
MNKNISHLKKILASHIRGGDFSHPGETEAIDIVMGKIPKNPNQTILDVGCGLGGTAKYLKDNGYGLPVGIDIDKDNIGYATNKYSDIKFYHCDVLDSFKFFKPQSFDIIWLFSSFLLFADQSRSLSILSNLAHKHSKLVLFDYTLLSNSSVSFISESHKPIDIVRINDILLKAGWSMEQFVDITSHFLKWYIEFSNKIQSRKLELINLFGIDAYNNFFTTYNNYAELYKTKALGGCFIFATKL